MLTSMDFEQIFKDEKYVNLCLMDCFINAIYAV